MIQKVLQNYETFEAKFPKFQKLRKTEENFSEIRLKNVKFRNITQNQSKSSKLRKNQLNSAKLRNNSASLAKLCIVEANIKSFEKLKHILINYVKI